MSLLSRSQLAIDRATEAWGHVKETLQLPSSSEYATLCHDAVHHSWLATRSLTQLGSVTLRPFVILFGLSIDFLWFLFSKYVFRGVYVSTCKGFKHLGLALKIILQWQMTRSRQVLAIEGGILAFMMLCYLLRRQIRKKKYIPRAKRYLRRQRRRVKEVRAIYFETVSIVLGPATISRHEICLTS
jgi:hypothetical protein